MFLYSSHIGYLSICTVSHVYLESDGRDGDDDAREEAAVREEAVSTS